MTKGLLLVLVFFMVVIPGCASVAFKKPLYPNKKYYDESLIGRWHGNSLKEDKSFLIVDKIPEENNGYILMAINANSAEKEYMVRYKFYLTKQDHNIYFNISLDSFEICQFFKGCYKDYLGSSVADGYSVGRVIKKDNDNIYLSFINEIKIKESIEQGKYKGEIDCIDYDKHGKSCNFFLISLEDDNDIFQFWGSSNTTMTLSRLAN
ncbi:MAG: hypothetical protein R1F54_05395 [Candidatus Zeuxoniibacter abyssi]|nr:MAG: hypothetical protein R1F54_05395 [Candidatus Persebacteraceae bacterium AB1(2)]